MMDKRLINNAKRYQGCLSKISKMFGAEIALWDGAGRCIFRSSNGKRQQRSILTSETLRQVFEDIQISGPAGVDKRVNSFRLIGIPIGLPSTMGMIVAGYKISVKEKCNGTSPKIQDILKELSKLIEEDCNVYTELNSLTIELATRFEELNLIYGIGDKLKDIEDSTYTIKYILKEVLNVLPGQTVILSAPDYEIFDYVSSNPHCSKEKLFQFTNKIKELCDAENPHLVINKFNEFKDKGFTNMNWVKVIAAPVKVKDEYKGTLIVLNDHRKENYSTGDVRLLKVLAGQLSIIITNDELYQNLKDFLLNLVKSMVFAIEAKDSYTRGHSERVSNISLMIAKAMGFSRKDMENISWASILHDIGKIGIPENILTKPGKLTDEEYTLIKTHPQKGYEILEPITQLKAALQGVLHHQERYDGKGYPVGLKGKDIPLYARIIALADTYDSITSSRAYRAHNSHIDAMEEIERVSGSQLDPEVVEVFKKVCDASPGFIREKQE